jgi:hypothetical protein
MSDTEARASQAARAALHPEIDEGLVTRWHEHGWTFFEGLLDRAEVERAAGELGMVYPHEPSRHGISAGAKARFNARTDFRIPENSPFRFETQSGPAYRRAQFAGFSDFPFTSDLLNRLVVHDRILAAAARLLRQPLSQIRLYQAQCVAKYTGATDYEQPLHLDFSTHTLLTPQPGEQVEMFLYLCDVTPDLAPTHLVSRKMTEERACLPYFLMPSDAPDLYAAEESAPGPTGSVLAYGPGVWHRAVNLTKPGGARYWLGLSFKVVGCDWLGFQSFPRAGMQDQWRRFVEQSTPDQLSVMGVPSPGHGYWTSARVSEFSLRYPALDVRPWRRALL